MAVSSLFGGGASAAPTVVTTIRPIYSLVAGIMHGAGTPHLLIQGAQSPHTYTLQPSQARLIQEADLIIWVGASLETFLPKLLEKAPEKARIVKLLDSPLLSTCPYRFLESHDHKKGDGFQAPVEIKRFEETQVIVPEKKETRDPHIWLDPKIAEQIVEEITTVLSEIDHTNAPIYSANRTRLVERLRSLDQKLQMDLHFIRGRPYFSAHDSYQYFDRRFGIQSAGVISLHPEKLSKPKHLESIYKEIKDKNVQCIFAEKEFPSSTVQTIAERSNVKMATLDPLGAGIEPVDENLYFTLMENLARSFIACLQPSPM